MSTRELLAVLNTRIKSGARRRLRRMSILRTRLTTKPKGTSNS